MLRIVALCLLLALSPMALSQPQRIVSIGLCSDQLLLLIATREQIASVSSWARDARLSYMIDAVGDIPLNDASLEQIIGLAPDLVVASEFVARDTVRFLRHLGYRVEQVPVATSVEQIYQVLDQFGRWTGNLERAREVVEQMQQRLAEIRSGLATGPKPRAIIYSPNGYTVGVNTLEHELLIQAGYRNLAAEMGIEGFQVISLERLIVANPDVLQIDSGLSPQASLASAYLDHPALVELLQRRDRFDIPLRQRICAGPMIVDAIEQMASRR